MSKQTETMKLALEALEDSAKQPVGKRTTDAITALREALAEQPAPVQSALDAMWVALAAYQPQADADGHGETWAAMCSEKTSTAAYAAAYDAACAAAAAAAASNAANADAANAAAAVRAAIATEWAKKATARINELQEKT